jgi:hypothetical protein
VTIGTVCGPECGVGSSRPAGAENEGFRGFNVSKFQINTPIALEAFETLKL